MKKFILMVLMIFLIGCNKKVNQIENTTAQNVLTENEVVEETEVIENAMEEEKIEIKIVDYETFKTDLIRILPERLNVRDSASGDGAIISSVHKGALFKVEETQKDTDEKTWYKITYDDKQSGWVAGWFCNQISKVDEANGFNFETLVIKTLDEHILYTEADLDKYTKDTIESNEIYELFDNSIVGNQIWYKIYVNNSMRWIKAENTEVCLSNEEYVIDDDFIIEIKEPIFEMSLRETYGFPSEIIKYKDVKDIKELIIKDYVEAVDGVEYFTGVENLEIHTENFRIFDFLKMKNLRSLTINNVEIPDFELISQFKKIKEIDDTSKSSEGENAEDTQVDSKIIKVENNKPFVIEVSGMDGNFIPGYSWRLNDPDVTKLVYGFGLMTRNEFGQIVNSPLVESRTVSDDFMEWTFKIADDITFHNGEKLSASDVMFTYNHFRLHSYGHRLQYEYEQLEDHIHFIEVDEKLNTVFFKLKEPSVRTDLQIFNDVFILPEETLTAGANQAGESISSYIQKNISNPIGYGPYILEVFEPSSYVRLSANSEYIDGEPSIKEIIMKPSTENGYNQLLSGDLDLIFSVDLDEINAIDSLDGFKRDRMFKGVDYKLVFYTDFQASQLKEVRQALAYAFNRIEFSEYLGSEVTCTNQAPYTKNQWMMYDNDELNLMLQSEMGRFEQSLIKYDLLDESGNFDQDATIKKVHELLTIAANKNDGEYINFTGDTVNGFYWKNEPFEINLATGGNSAKSLEGIWTDEYMSKLGFNVDIDNYQNVYSIIGYRYSEDSSNRKYHGYVIAGGYDEVGNPNDLYSSKLIKIWAEHRQNAPRFAGGASNTPEKWDKLLQEIEESRMAQDYDKYKSLWREYIQIMNEEIPILPVDSGTLNLLYNAKLENFDTHKFWPWTKAIVDAYWSGK